MGLGSAGSAWVYPYGVGMPSWDTDSDLGPYIATHLAYELKYLVVAATTWTAVHMERDRGAWPDHLVVMSMESAFVHTRTLGEFLLRDQGWASRSPHEAPELPLWNAYSSALHTRVLHPSPTRPQGSQVGRGADLKDRVLDLAREILDGWDEVRRQAVMAFVAGDMLAAHTTALAEGVRAARRLNVRFPLQ